MAARSSSANSSDTVQGSTSLRSPDSKDSSEQLLDAALAGSEEQGLRGLQSSRGSSMRGSRSREGTPRQRIFRTVLSERTEARRTLSVAGGSSSPTRRDGGTLERSPPHECVDHSDRNVYCARNEDIPDPSVRPMCPRIPFARTAQRMLEEGLNGSPSLAELYGPSNGLDALQRGDEGLEDFLVRGEAHQSGWTPSSPRPDDDEEDPFETWQKRRREDPTFNEPPPAPKPKRSRF